MKRYLEVVIHVVFWLLTYYITFANFGIKYQMINIGGEIRYVKEFRNLFLIIILIDIFFKSLMFYVNTNILLPRLFKSKNKTNIIFEISILFISTICFSLLINYYIVISHIEFELKKDGALISYSLLVHILFLLLSFGYRLAKDWFKNERIKSQIIQEKLETELNFLKAQINPHFLFNTLNNLYSEARISRNKTVANGIAKLSHIMRYMIYDSNVEFVTLDKEIQYLEGYIELQKLRISDKDPLELIFNKQDVDLSLPIAPILFIPFVENAFKYGLSIEHESFIHISIVTSGEKLQFKVNNSIFKVNSIEEHSGVGLANVQRRLDLLYPDKHSLIIEENSDEFKIMLELNLSK